MKTRNHLIVGIITVFFLMGTTVQAQETNYNESKVGTYVLPDALTTLNGQKVVNENNEKVLNAEGQEMMRLFTPEEIQERHTDRREPRIYRFGHGSRQARRRDRRHRPFRPRHGQ